LESGKNRFVKRMNIETEIEETLVTSEFYIHQISAFDGKMFFIFWKMGSDYETMEFDLSNMTTRHISNTKYFFSGKEKKIILPNPKEGTIGIYDLGRGGIIYHKIENMDECDKYTIIDRDTIIFRRLERVYPMRNTEALGGMYKIDLNKNKAKLLFKTKYHIVIGEFLDSF
jgi:hypothetical protein